MSERYVHKNSTLSFEELLQKDNSVTIHHRNLQKLATEMFKIINNHSPPIMKTIFPLSTNPYGLRNKNPLQTNNAHSVLNGTISFRSKNMGPSLREYKKIPITSRIQR